MEEGGLVFMPGKRKPMLVHRLYPWVTRVQGVDGGKAVCVREGVWGTSLCFAFSVAMN